MSNNREKSSIRKIVYFDRQTINNILQQQNKGKVSEQNTTKHIKNLSAETEVSSAADVKLSLPFTAKLKLFFTGKVSLSLLHETTQQTTVTATDISQFSSIKEQLESFENVQLKDIKNSETVFRVASSYMTIVNQQLEFDAKLFKSVLENFDGYDVYDINGSSYVRFNHDAFVSNYKRNELLLSELALYCVPVGRFSKEQFDFNKSITEFAQTLSDVVKPRTLAETIGKGKGEQPANTGCLKDEKTDSKVMLFDALYAEIGNCDSYAVV